MKAHKWLKPGPCPFCDKNIFLFDRDKPVKLNDDGMSFWVRFNDNSIADFTICNECFQALTQDKINELMDNQIYTWGQEIINSPLSIISLASQLKWYVNTAVFLKVIKWSKDKDGT